MQFKRLFCFYHASSDSLTFSVFYKSSQSCADLNNFSSKIEGVFTQDDVVNSSGATAGPGRTDCVL